MDLSLLKKKTKNKERLRAFPTASYNLFHFLHIGKMLRKSQKQPTTDRFPEHYEYYSSTQCVVNQKSFPIYYFNTKYFSFFSHIFSLFPKNNKLQNILTFLTFYIISVRTYSGLMTY
jgi:restriction endonuclease S subunit